MARKNVDKSGSTRSSGRAGSASKEGGGFSVSQEPVIGDRAEEDAHKYEATAGDPALPDAAPTPAYEDLGPLPSSYHEDTLFLVARDPHWLFCYWDFDWTRYSAAKQRDAVARFYLKIWRVGVSGDESLVEIRPEARNWYVPVSHADAVYMGEIGYHRADGTWMAIVRSGTARTPPDAVGAFSGAEFATVPQHLAFERLLNLLTGQMREGEALLQTVARIANAGADSGSGAEGAGSWSGEQRAILSTLLGESLADRAQLGSADIDQLLRRQLRENLQSQAASELSLRLLESFAPTTSSLFSAIGASWSAQPFSVRRERGFFMHVNAEIIFYGGTHPDATVWIRGEKIKLNPDGTFRYHFTLGDGDFSVPIVARSPDNVEERSATLTFSRGTERRGDVGATPQPPELSPFPR